STTKLPLKIFGTVHAGFFANSANPNWLDNPNLVGAPPATGGNGTMSASLRQTRGGVAAGGPPVGSGRTQALPPSGFFRGPPGVPDRTGDGASAPAGGVGADGRHRYRARGRAGSHDPGAPRSDIARGVLVPAALPVRQPLPAHAAGANRAGADVAPPRHRRHRRANRRRFHRSELRVRAAGARR